MLGWQIMFGGSRYPTTTVLIVRSIPELGCAWRHLRHKIGRHASAFWTFDLKLDRLSESRRAGRNYVATHEYLANIGHSFPRRVGGHLGDGDARREIVTGRLKTLNYAAEL